VTTHDFADALKRLAPNAFRTGLRPAQDRVLRTFAAEHTGTADLAIGLPTGEGKTLIGLLLADWALDQGMSVAYLTGTKQLAEQVQHQAAPLAGLPVHLFYAGHYPGAELLACNEARAVAVMNYWVYFNSNPKVAPADMVIFDDAHLAEQPLADLFTLRVTRSSSGGLDLYESLCDLLLQSASAAYPTLKAMREVRHRDPVRQSWSPSMTGRPPPTARRT
jgi:Rad3-related DNA helicase